MNHINEILQLLEKYNVKDNDLFELLNEIERRLVLSYKIEKTLYDSDLYLVYKHTDPNGKVYIGITQNHPQTRWNEGGGYESQNKFYKAIQKYGWINFDHEILDASLTKDEAIELENKYILEFKSYDAKYGYNTRVDSNALKSKIEPDNKKPNQICDIANELIDDYGVVTVNNKIFCCVDGIFVNEDDEKILAKKLITKYNIPIKKQKEILDTIKLLSNKKIENLPFELHFLLNCEENSIFKWIGEANITIEQLTKQSCDYLYIMYAEWCENSKSKQGKKTFYKTIEEKYKFKRKQKSDGKRYFVDY